jgi:sugar O-acyltransferase (sialic acid O-acetyltransferase NeuD family)
MSKPSELLESNMPTKNLIILGAGGYARQVYWVASRTCMYRILGFVDETISEDKTQYGIPVRTKLELFNDIGEPFEIICAVGDISLRKRWYSEYSRLYHFATIIDPSSLIAPDSSIAGNVVILAQSICSSHCKIGISSNINWQCTVAHDVKIGNFVDIASGVKIAGDATIENDCEIGTNATILPRITIGEGSIIGAGAVVNRDIPPRSVAVGVPAKVIRTIDK